MKFTITEVFYKPTRFGEIKYFNIKNSLYEKTVHADFNNKHLNVGDKIDTHYHHWSKRLCDRLSKIGIDIQLGCNYPWVYLDKVNDVKVSEIKNCEHGFCIGYATSDKIRFKKDLFEKLMEVLYGV